MKLLGLAWKNLLSNVRRTAITLLSIVIGLGSLIFLWSFIDGLNEQMIENSTGYITGDIQIHRKGYHQSQEMNLALVPTDNTEKIVKNQPGITGYASRVEGTAMLSAGEKTRAVNVFGVDPEQEPKVTRIAKSLIAGRWFDGKQDNEIILGAATQTAFNLKLGDEVVLVTQAADGSLGADRYRIQGFFSTGIEQMDRQLAFIPLTAAQSLFALEGRFTTLAIHVADRQRVPEITQSLRQQSGKNVEVYDWKTMLPSMVQMIAFHDAVTYVVLLVVFVVVAAGITNTILMSVMERTREFGVMMAVGTQSSQILLLVLLETLLIALIGMAVGTVLGTSITQYFAQSGMDLGQYSSAMETMPGLSGLVHPFLQIKHVIIVNALVLVVTVLPALYPAWKASRLLPVIAIRGNAPDILHFPALFSGKASRNFKFGHIAFRNIFRNPKRSLLTAGASAFGLAAYLFLYAFADGFFEQMIENSISNQSGHVQIFQSGFRPDLSPDKRIQHYEKLLPLINNLNPAESGNTIEVSPRVVTNAMVASPRKSEPIQLYGIDPIQEQQVTRLQNYVQAGRYLNAEDNLSKGAGHARQPALILGHKTAKKLQVNIGDKVVITTQRAGGELSSAAYKLVGIINTGSDMLDSTLALTAISSARSLLGFAEHEASSLVIRLPDRVQSATVALQLRTLIQSDLQHPIVVETWEQILPVVIQMVDMTRIDFYVILAVVFVVVAIGIMNTMLMSVLERTREFGMLMALGTLPRQVIFIILLESMILGLFGLFFGALVGGGITAYYHWTGIDLSAFVASMSTIPGMTETVTPVLILDHVIWPTIMLFFAGIAVSLYPAFKAATLQPVEAMRHG